MMVLAYALQLPMSASNGSLRSKNQGPSLSTHMVVGLETHVSSCLPQLIVVPTPRQQLLTLFKTASGSSWNRLAISAMRLGRKVPSVST